MTHILGIVNVTADSFSDGGRYLDPAAAVEHALRLADEGADLVDLGAESTHPAAQAVAAEVEIERLAPVIERLRAAGVPLSIDTTKAEVMRYALRCGAAMINNVAGFRDDESVATVRDSDARLVVMHAKRGRAVAGGDSGQTAAPRGCPGAGGSGRAAPVVSDPAAIVAEIIAFFRERVGALVAAGIARQRLILDPGMGFFLGSNAEASFAVLRGLPQIKAALGLPVMVSLSRKSFIGAALAEDDRRRSDDQRRRGDEQRWRSDEQRRRAAAPPQRPVDRRGAGTLAAELWAVEHGADYVRTHEVAPLRDALTVRAALAGGAAKAGGAAAGGAAKVDE